jgi:cell division protein FtsB
MIDLKICPNPEDCCRELTRVWTALNVGGYNGKSASENVAQLQADLAALTAERDALKADVNSLIETLHDRQRFDPPQEPRT